MWVDDLRGVERALVMWAAMLARCYWVALGWLSLFSARELYLTLLAVAYTTEPLVWACARTLLRPGVPAAPSLLSLVSHDLTFEVELCGTFVGFLAFHVGYYRAGVSHVGSKTSGLLLGVLCPVAMVWAGTDAGVARLADYVVYWGVGVASGAWRGAWVASMFATRLRAWELVFHGGPPRCRSDVKDSILRDLMTGSGGVGVN